MCGRLSQALPAELLIRLFGVTDVRREVPPPSWNVASMQSDRRCPRRARLRCAVFDMEWGLLAPWKGHWETARVRPINVRCETIMASGMFTVAIVTTPAAEELTSIHARMPLVLEPDAWPLWLGETESDASSLLRPAEPGRMNAWRVDRAVGSPRNNGPHLLQAA